MGECKHDLADRETACADGMCPLCLGAEVARLKNLFEHGRMLVAGVLEHTSSCAESLDEILEQYESEPTVVEAVGLRERAEAAESLLAAIRAQVEPPPFDRKVYESDYDTGHLDGRAHIAFRVRALFEKHGGEDEAD